MDSLWSTLVRWLRLDVDHLPEVEVLVERRRRLFDENRALLLRAKADRRDVLTTEEEREWTACDAAIDELSKIIAAHPAPTQTKIGHAG
jgi:hypothetical protein